MISKAADMGGVSTFPEVDEMFRLVVEKGADINYTYENVSIKQYIDHIVNFYAGKIKDDKLFINAEDYEGYESEKIHASVRSREAQIILINIPEVIKKKEAEKLKTFEHAIKTSIKKGDPIDELDEGVKEKIGKYLRGIGIDNLPEVEKKFWGAKGGKRKKRTKKRDKRTKRKKRGGKDKKKEKGERTKRKKSKSKRTKSRKK